MKKYTLPESRLSSLYSDFRTLEELNPEGFNANVIVWKGFLLNNICQNSLILNCGNSLLDKLNSQKYGPPQSIDVVIDNLVSEGQLVLLNDYKNGKPNAVLSTLRWALSKTPLRSHFKSRIKPSGPYLKHLDLVVMPTLERKYELIEEKMKSCIYENATRFSDLVFLREDFCQKLQMDEILKGWSEYEIMLSFLERYKGEIVMNNDVVKVCAKNVRSLVKNFEPSQITANDTSIASLKSLSRKISVQIEHLEKSISHYSKLVGSNIENNRSKDIQRTHLRIKKMLEKSLTKSYANFQKMEETKNSIESALDNVSLFEVLQNSTETIKLISAELGSVEEVEKSLTESENEISKVEEISNAITGFSNDDEEIDNELEVMEKEIEKEHETLDKLAGLRIQNDKLEESHNEIDDESDHKLQTKVVLLEN